jgi:hypothetical protein
VARGHRLKAKVVEIMGGKCSNPNCGLKYNGKNACIFQMHHNNPSEKLFPINTRTLINYNWSMILDEIIKCSLLCANCHFLIENEEY